MAVCRFLAALACLTRLSAYFLTRLCLTDFWARRLCSAVRSLIVSITMRISASERSSVFTLVGLVSVLWVGGVVGLGLEGAPGTVPGGGGVGEAWAAAT